MTQPGPHWWPAYIGLGSNLDIPRQHVESAILSIGKIDGCFMAARSSLYRSAPLGPANQPDFVNAVVAILTTLDPHSLLKRLQDIENAEGRDRGTERWGPRTLDLDLLAYAGLTLEDPQLTLPHPGIAVRNFVLLPFAEIAPDVVIPGLGRVAMLAREVEQSPESIEKIAP